HWLKARWASKTRTTLRTLSPLPAVKSKKNGHRVFTPPGDGDGVRNRTYPGKNHHRPGPRRGKGTIRKKERFGHDSAHVGEEVVHGADGGAARGGEEGPAMAPGPGRAGGAGRAVDLAPVPDLGHRPDPADHHHPDRAGKGR